MKIAFRIDASSSIGTGHFVRMSALARAFEGLGCSCAFFRGEHEPIDYEPFDIVILDTYEISSSYISQLKTANRLLVCYDDNALYTYDCHVLLNANFHAHELKFKFLGKKPLTLFGPQYALLRDEFQNAKPIEVREAAKEIFVCFGGSDLRGFTPAAVNALRDMPGISLNVVLGTHTSCDREVGHMKSKNARVHKNPANISEIMASCDIALTGAGSMVYELACLGIPSIVVAQADNQKLIADYLERHMLMKYAGDWDRFQNIRQEAEKLLGDYARRKAESERLAKAVNKQGAMAAAKAILGVAHEHLGRN